MSEALPPLDNTLGAVLIGAVLGTFLFGVSTLQAFQYYRLYSDDPRRMKALVAGIWIIELGHSISLWHALYQMVVTFYGQVQHIFNPPHSLEMTVLFSAGINLVVQSFFAYRIYTLSKSIFIPVVCSILTLARFTFNMLMLVEFWESSGFAIFQTKLKWLMLCVSAIGPSVDVLIATSLCFYLWRIRSRGGTFQQTKRMIDTLIMWSVETTSITCAAGVLQLILYLSMPSNLVWIAFFLMQPKLFSNSILAHLNGRERLRTGTTKVHTNSEGYDSRATRPDRLVIQMHTMSKETRDPLGDRYPENDVYPKEKRAPPVLSV
ncbi:hypothetical protein C8F01DRAFT_1106145 [Mycena amicta]|nr:hypothetical protein C8F01DRAFT_1106145 [Mycena amicta]